MRHLKQPTILTGLCASVAFFGVNLLPQSAAAEGTVSDYPDAIATVGTFTRHVFLTPQTVKTATGVSHDNVTTIFADTNGNIQHVIVLLPDVVADGGAQDPINCPEGQIRFGEKCVDLPSPDGSGSVGSALSVPYLLNFELAQDENGEFQYVARDISPGASVIWNDPNAPALIFNNQALSLGNQQNNQGDGG